MLANCISAESLWFISALMWEDNGNEIGTFRSVTIRHITRNVLPRYYTTLAKPVIPSGCICIIIWVKSLDIETYVKWGSSRNWYPNLLETQKYHGCESVLLSSEFESDLNLFRMQWPQVEWHYDAEFAIAEWKKNLVKDIARQSPMISQVVLFYATLLCHSWDTLFSVSIRKCFFTAFTLMNTACV